MHAYMFRSRFWWIRCAFGRNPLLRWTDRLEAWVIVVAILIALAATPVCALAGAGVYRSQLQLYTAQARARQSVTATVIETGPALPHATRVDALATWGVAVGSARTAEFQREHTGWVSTDRAVKVGDRIDIWVNDVGALSAPPTPLSQARVDALGFGAGMWLAATVTLAVAVGVVRSPLNRIRRVQWEREIEGFAAGGRSNRAH